MSPETRFRALCVLELDNRRVLYRLLPNTEHPRRHLRNHMITIRNNSIRITALTSRRVRPDLPRSPRPGQHKVERDRSKRHTPTINRQRNLNFPTFPSFVQRDRKINFLRFNLRKPVVLPSQNIKTPTRIPNLILQTIFRQIPCQRHLVSRQYQLRGPALVPQPSRQTMTERRENL